MWVYKFGNLNGAKKNVNVFGIIVIVFLDESFIKCVCTVFSEKTVDEQPHYGHLALL